MLRNTTLLLILGVAATSVALAQPDHAPPSIRIMTLGVFHFDYPNLDAVKVDEEDQVSVLDEPYRTEIRNLSEALRRFRPTVIAIEQLPEHQVQIDSLYAAYLDDRLELGRSEVQQLGFRLGKALGLSRLYCIDDRGRHYENVTTLFEDGARLARFEAFYLQSPDTAYVPPKTGSKVTSILDALEEANDPDRVKAELGMYLLRQFKYEEKPGDFTGVDFETGRWFNRNLRIFRNIQRIPLAPDDRVLLIIGSGHLNVLNHLFDVSREFELVSPLPTLQQARMIGGEGN